MSGGGDVTKEDTLKRIALDVLSAQLPQIKYFVIGLSRFLIKTEDMGVKHNWTCSGFASRRLWDRGPSLPHE